MTKITTAANPSFRDVFILACNDSSSAHGLVLSIPYSCLPNQYLRSASRHEHESGSTPPCAPDFVAVATRPSNCQNAIRHSPYRIRRRDRNFRSQTTHCGVRLDHEENRNETPEAASF